MNENIYERHLVLSNGQTEKNWTPKDSKLKSWKIKVSISEYCHNILKELWFRKLEKLRKS